MGVLVTITLVLVIVCLHQGDIVCILERTMHVLTTMMRVSETMTLCCVEIILIGVGKDELLWVLYMLMVLCW